MIKFECHAKRPDGEKLYRLVIDGRVVREGLTIDEVIAKNLKVVDMTASILARENRMPMFVFGLNEENSILRAAEGAIDGTKVTV